MSRAGVHQVAATVGGNKRPMPRRWFRAMARVPTDPVGADEAEAAPGNRVEGLRVVRRGHRGLWWPPITLATAAVTSTSAASIGTGTWSLPHAKQGRHADILGRLNRQAGQAVGGLPSIRRPQRDCTMPEAVTTAHPALAEPWALPGRAVHLASVPPPRSSDPMARSTLTPHPQYGIRSDNVARLGESGRAAHARRNPAFSRRVAGSPFDHSPITNRSPGGGSFTPRSPATGRHRSRRGERPASERSMSGPGVLAAPIPEHLKGSRSWHAVISPPTRPWRRRFAC